MARCLPTGSLYDPLPLQSRAILDFLGRRPGDHTQKIVGTLHDSHFDGVRYKLLSQLQGSVHDVMDSYDRDKEGDALVSALKQTLIQTAVLEAGAVTVGGLITAHLLDPFGGIAAASSLAILGVLVMPIRRRSQQAHFRKQVCARPDFMFLSGHRNPFVPEALPSIRWINSRTSWTKWCHNAWRGNYTRSRSVSSSPSRLTPGSCKWKNRRQARPRPR